MSPKTFDLSCPSANEIDRHVGAQIKRLRKQNKLAMVDIAQVIGVTYQQVQKYEKGTNRVSVGMLYRLARCFKVPITAFYDGLDNTQNTAHPARLAAQENSSFSQANDEAHSLLRLHPSVRGHVEALIMALATKRPIPPKNS